MKYAVDIPNFGAWSDPRDVARLAADIEAAGWDGLAIWDHILVWDGAAVVEAHAGYLASNPTASLTLEGHADERGSTEYNMALGDRRAQSVRRILLFQGASTDQLETISYGEERPAQRGHEEESWSQNRRVELVYEVR